jgi:hypothetical protein
MKVSQWTGKKQPGSANIEKSGALFGQVGQQFDDVELVEQTVDECHDCSQHLRFPGCVHHCPLSSLCGDSTVWH